MNHASLVALLPLVLHVACVGPNAAPRPSDPDAPPGRACTEMGCENGFHASFEAKAPLAPGHYTVDVEADGKRGSYEVDIPLPPCGTGGRNTGDLSFTVGESGCALPPDQHTLSDLRIPGKPASVHVRISRPGTVLAEVTLTPGYRENRPNGPDCEPVCVSASEKIVLTSP